MNQISKRSRDKLEVLASYVKTGNLEECLNTMSYLTGLGGVFYALELVQELESGQIERLREAVRNKMEPK